MRLVKDALLRIPGVAAVQSRRHGHGTGRMYDPVEVHALFGGHVARLAPHWSSPFGKTAVELGPGNSLAQAVLWSLLGAERVLAVDVRRYATRDSAPEVYRRVLASVPERIEEGRLPDLLGPEGRSIRTAELFPDDDFTFPSLGNRIDYRITDGDRLPLPDASADLIYSISVLEHVRDPALAYSEMYRVLKSGGLCSHIIDLRDHHHAEPLDFLRYSDPLWRYMAGRSAGWTNRLRASDHLEAIESAGLEIASYEPRKLENIPDPDSLDQRFRRKDSSDLAEAAMILILRKP